MQTTEKEQKEIMVDIAFPPEKITEIVDKFIEESFSNKEFSGEASVEVYKTKFCTDNCRLEVKVSRNKQIEKE